MATIVPKTIPSKATPDEKHLFSVLKKLPKDCSVFYEPLINQRQPDFIVVSPRIGIMVIEAKGWSLDYIDTANHLTVQVKSKGRIEDRTNPAEQAKQYMFDTMNMLKNADKACVITNTTGSYRGNLKFPVGFAVAMSNLSRHEANNNKLSAVFQSQNYIFKDDIESLEKLTSGEIELFLKGKFTSKWKSPLMTDKQFKAITRLINPVIKIKPSSNATVNKPSKPDDQSANMPIGELLSSIKQPIEAASDGENHVEEYIPKDIYDTISQSFAQLLGNTKESRQNIAHHKQRVSYLKQQISVAELLISEQGALPQAMTQEDDANAIESTKKTVVKHDCQRIEAFATSMSQLVTDNKIDKALEAFDQMKLHAVTTRLRLEYIQELKQLLNEMEKQQVLESKVGHISRILNPNNAVDQPTKNMAIPA